MHVPTVKFKYHTPPGDFFRNAETQELPDPEHDLETFLIWFLDNYQSDNRIAYLDDLAKLLDDDFENNEARQLVLNSIGHLSKSEIREEIANIEAELKFEAFKNFYWLTRANKIEIVAAHQERS